MLLINYLSNQHRIMLGINSTFINAQICYFKVLFVSFVANILQQLNCFFLTLQALDLFCLLIFLWHDGILLWVYVCFIEFQYGKVLPFHRYA